MMLKQDCKIITIRYISNNKDQYNRRFEITIFVLMRLNSLRRYFSNNVVSSEMTILTAIWPSYTLARQNIQVECFRKSQIYLSHEHHNPVTLG